jgi:hypothetical protein
MATYITIDNPDEHDITGNESWLVRFTAEQMELLVSVLESEQGCQEFLGSDADTLSGFEELRDVLSGAQVVLKESHLPFSQPYFE